MTERRPLSDAPWNGPAKQHDGIIVTGRIGVAQVVRHATGPIAVALAQATEGLDEVLSISSPATIWRDLQGTRADLDSSTTGDGARKLSTAYPAFPEPHLLHYIGRSDLWRGPKAGT